MQNIWLRLIYQVFYWIKIFKNSKKIIIFFTKYEIFKYWIILFNIYNGLIFW